MADSTHDTPEHTTSPPPHEPSPQPPNLPDRPPAEPEHSVESHDEPRQTTSNPSSPPPPQAERQRETVVDPRVVALRGMFPDYDDAILQSVLESAGGNQDRAIDILLGMSDPDYKPEHAPHQALQQQQQIVQPTPVMTQEELDEQFARQLMLQDQQQQEQQWLNAQAQGQGGYQVRQSGRRPQWSPAPQQQQQPQQGQGDRPMGEFQEQFSKIAESGKKTFGNLFSKVKAKIQEFESGRPAGQASPSQQQWSPPPGQPQQPQQQYWQPQPIPQHQQQQAAYYDPNPNPNLSASVSPSRTPGSTATGGSGSGVGSGSREVTEGYDVSSPPSPPPTVRLTSQQLQPQPSPAPVPPPTSPAQIDAGKLGLLPKRPVSLLRETPGGSGSQAQPAAHHDHYDDEDDDGLEYAENPFEEGKK